MTQMDEDPLDEDALFENFESAGTGSADAVTSEIKQLRKHLNKGKSGATEDEEEEDEDAEDTEESDSAAQKKYIGELEEQNNKLKAIIKRMIGPQSFKLDETQKAAEDELEEGEIDLIKQLDDNIQSKPFAIVLFLNNDMSTIHRKEIDDMMQGLSEKDVRQDVLLSQKLEAQHSAVPLKSFSANSKGRRYNLPKQSDGEDPYVICACQYYKSFYVDRMGAPLLECNPCSTDIWSIPSYEQTFLKALPIVEESLNIRVKQMRRCFNCDGDHNMTECPEPKDQAKINLNRQQFSANKNNAPAQQDDELDERFKHFKPGEISVALEEALDISLEKQLPPYIYKMRVMGYPPAYLKPMEEGLKMYGADGENLGDPEAEEGEIAGVKLPDVINYAGYNASMPEGVRDDFQSMCSPPFNAAEADLHIAMNRAQALGYIENEVTDPCAKKLKYDDDADMSQVDMDVDTESSDNANSSPSKDKQEKSTEEKENEKGDEKAAKNVVEGKESKLSKKEKKDKAKSKEIDETTYRHWNLKKPFTTGGITYVMYTPPPTCRCEVNLLDLPKKTVTDLDREPWKTASTSWYDPLYGDLSAPTGTYDAIRTLLKDTRRVKRKPMT